MNEESQDGVVRYVAGFAFDKGCRTVALVRKARPAWQAGKLNGIGGHIEEGETPEMAMEREFGEEAGLDLGGWEHFATLTGNGFEVVFFRIESSLVRGVRSAGDEPVDLYPVATLGDREDRISNIGWLVNMALAGSRHDWPYLIREKVEAAA
jgi:8-oxo-dGTP diphosphatase